MATNGSLANHDVVTLAVYLLGGASQPVHTEDVAVRANQLAPGRFTWRKYPDQINLELVRVYLSDAKKVQKGSLLVGSGSGGWLLSVNGLAFARKNLPRIEAADTSRDNLGVRERRWIRAERARILADPTTEKWRSDGAGAITPQEAEALFRVDEYVRGTARSRKVTRILNTYGDDPELGDALRELAAKVRSR